VNETQALQELRSFRRLEGVFSFAIVASAVIIALRLFSGCSGGAREAELAVRRADNALDAKQYDEALEKCIADAQDGGPRYTECERQVDAKYRRSR
jgi:hypothetical protein